MGASKDGIPSIAMFRKRFQSKRGADTAGRPLAALKALGIAVR